MVEFWVMRYSLETQTFMISTHSTNVLSDSWNFKTKIMMAVLFFEQSYYRAHSCCTSIIYWTS